MGKHEGQRNGKKAWINMMLYWGLGHVIGVREGYYSKLQWKAVTSMHILALLTTVECQRRMNTRFSSFGRKPDYAATIVFTMANAVFETFSFIFVYDLGRKYLADALSLSKGTSITIGFLFYYIYAALIHILFWLPLVFPKHTKADAPPFHKHGLPLLTLISIGWFALYETYDDITFVCMLHAIVDFWGSVHISLQSPLSHFS